MYFYVTHFYIQKYVHRYSKRQSAKETYIRDKETCNKDLHERPPKETPSRKCTHRYKADARVNERVEMRPVFVRKRPTKDTYTKHLYVA